MLHVEVSIFAAEALEYTLRLQILLLSLPCVVISHVVQTHVKLKMSVSFDFSVTLPHI